MVLKVSDFDKVARDQYLRLDDKGQIEVCGKGFKGWLTVKWLRLKMIFSKNARRKYIEQNQKVMVNFIETIKREYGKQWGFVAFRCLTRDFLKGKPLTGYKIKSVLQQIEPYQAKKANAFLATRFAFLGSRNTPFDKGGDLLTLYEDLKGKVEKEAGRHVPSLSLAEEKSLREQIYNFLLNGGNWAEATKITKEAALSKTQQVIEDFLKIRAKASSDSLTKSITTCFKILKNPILDKSLLLTHLSKLNEFLLVSYRNQLPPEQILERDKREEVALNLITPQLAAYSDADIEKLHQNLNNSLFIRFNTAMGYSQFFIQENFDSYKERVVDELTQMGEPLEMLQIAVAREAKRRGLNLSSPSAETEYIAWNKIPKDDKEIIKSFIQKRSEEIKKIYQDFIPRFLDSLQQAGGFKTFKISLKQFVEANQVYSGAEECWQEHLTTFLAQKSDQELQLLANNLQECRKSWFEYLKTPEAKMLPNSLDINKLSDEEIWQLIPSQYKRIFESTELAIQEELRKRGLQ